MTSCQCFATTIDPRRAEMWKRIFPPDGHVPIKNPLPEGLGNLAGAEDLYYLVDLDRVSDVQMALMVRELTALFNLTPLELLTDIQEQGVPVKAGGVIVSWCPLHSRMAT